jgi:hypothetical protein
MKKGKDKTKVEKAVDLLFEGNLDLSTVLGKGGAAKRVHESHIRTSVSGRNVRSPWVQTL